MRNAILCIPAEAWETMRETLELDARSKAFDKDLRNTIAAALGTVTYIGDDVKQLIDQYDISGYGVGEDIQNLQIVTGLMPGKDADDDEEDEDARTERLRKDFPEDDDPPWRDEQ